MKAIRSLFALAGPTSLALMTLAVTGAAHADNVYWSVGLNSPGVQVTLTSPQPVYVRDPVYYVQPQPVYVQPQVVYQQPQPVYVQPRSYYPVQTAPVYVAPRVVYTGWHHPPHGWHHEGRHHSRHESRHEVRSEVRKEMRRDGPFQGRVASPVRPQSNPRAHQFSTEQGNGFMMR